MFTYDTPRMSWYSRRQGGSSTLPPTYRCRHICQQWVPLQLTVYANLRSSSAYTRSGWGRARTRAYPLLHRVITSRQVGSHDLRHIQFLLPPLLSYSRLFLTSQTTYSSLQPYHFNSTFYYRLPPYSICFSIANTNTLFA